MAGLAVLPGEAAAVSVGRGAAGARPGADVLRVWDLATSTAGRPGTRAWADRESHCILVSQSHIRNGICRAIPSAKYPVCMRTLRSRWQWWKRTARCTLQSANTSILVVLR